MSSDILDLIDTALADSSVSADAMRNIPAGTPRPDMAALLVRADATVEAVALPGEDNLPAMYAAIGCTTVDAVEVRPGLDAWIDDEGLINGSEPNSPATAIARWYGAQCTDLYGPVLFTGGTDAEGNTRALSETWQRHIRAQCADMRGDD
jgi:hypothetical protein